MARYFLILFIIGFSLTSNAQQRQRLAVDLLNPGISMLDGIQNNMQIQVLHQIQNQDWRRFTGVSIVGMNNIDIKEYQGQYPSATLTYERYFCLDHGYEYLIPLRSSFYASLGGIAHLGRIQYELQYHPSGSDRKSQWIAGLSPSIAVNRDINWTTVQLKLNLRSMQSWGEVEILDGKGGFYKLKNPRTDLYQSIRPYVQIMVIMPLL